MKRAPTWRATAIDMRPMGPQPVTSTSSPTTENASAVCTALPNGSKIAPTSGSTGDVVHPHVLAGEHDVLGERAVAVHADALRADAHLATPGAAVAAHAADDVTLARHPVADGDVVHERADLDDLAVELVAGDERRRDRRRGPVVPPLDVQVGAADAGAKHPDLHVAGPGLGLGSVDVLQAGAGRRFVEGLHR